MLHINPTFTAAELLRCWLSGILNIQDTHIAVCHLLKYLPSLVILLHTKHGEYHYFRTCILPWVITKAYTTECLRQRKVWWIIHENNSWFEESGLKTKFSKSILKVEWKKWKVISVWWSTSRYSSCENGRCNCINDHIMHLEQIGGCKQDILSTTVCLQM